MLRLTLNAIIFCFIIILSFNCTPSEDITSFEDNDPDPEYRLFNILDDYPALKEPFSNLDEREFNEKMNDLVNNNMEEAKIFLSLFEDIVYHPEHPLTDSIAVMRNVLWRMINQDEIDAEISVRGYAGSDDYFRDTAAFLDELSDADLGITGEVLSLGRKNMEYIKDHNTPEEIEEDMEETIIDMETEDEDEQYEAVDLQEMIGRLLMQCDENIWLYDHDGNPDTPDRMRVNREDIDPEKDKDTGLGNTARGAEALLSGLSQISGDETVKNYLFDIVREYGDIFTSEVNGKKVWEIFRDLICEIEDHMTIGGEKYGDCKTETEYYMNCEKYVNNELGNSIKELLTIGIDLFIRGNREISVISGDDYPLELLAKALNTMELSSDSIQKLEDSMYRMVRYDDQMRDRLLDPDSSNFTAMDKLLWLLALTINYGWRSSGTEDDLNDDFDNHGRYPDIPTGGIPTMNDAVLGMTTAPQEVMLKGLANYMMNIGTVDTILDYVEAIFGSWVRRYISAFLDSTGGFLTWFTGQLTGLELNVYGLALENPPGNLIHRYKEEFSASQIQNGELPLYLPKNCMGLTAMSGEQMIADFGTPWGGRHFTGVKTPWEYEGGGNGVYIPYCEDGLGTQNAGEWLLGFMARVTWEGQGPYYCKNRKPDQARTQVCSDGKTYEVYYAPNGKPAVWVRKPGANPATWIYREPRYGFKKEDGNLCRYRSMHTLDHYMMRAMDLDGNMRYYPFNDDLYNGEGTYASWEGWNKDGGPGKYTGDKSEDPCLSDPLCIDESGLDTIKSSTHVIYELIPGSMTLEDGTHLTVTNADRECETYEETIYKNIKWMLYEKKFFLVMPMPMGIEALSGMVKASATAYVILEGNGASALLSAGKTMSSDPLNFKGDGNARWKIKGGYGYSDYPGDSKFTVLVEGGQSEINLLGYTINPGNILSYRLVYDCLLGSSGLFLSCLGENVGAMDLLIFINPGARLKEIPSFACGEKHSFWLTHGNRDGKNPYWEDRNILLSVLNAFVGEFHMHPKLDNDINDQTVYPKSALAFRSALSLLPILAKPLVFYQQSGTPPIGGWGTELEEVRDSQGNVIVEAGAMPHDEIDTSKWNSPWMIPGPYLDPDYPRTADKEFEWQKNLPINAKNFYKPKYKRTLISILAESDPQDFPNGRCNGYLSLPYGMANNVVALIKEIGSHKFDDPEGADPDDYRTWGARKKIFYGLEQIATAIRPTKAGAELIDKGYINDEKYTIQKRDWMFSENGVRTGDVLLDDLLEDIVGYDAQGDLPGKGLANYPDVRPNLEDWNDYEEESEEDIDFLSDKNESGGKYNLTDDIVDLMDKVLGRVNVDDKDARGLRHTAGTFFSMYNHQTKEWEYPDDLDILTMKELPHILRVYQGHYSEFVTFTVAMLKEGGFLDYIMNTFECPSFTSEELLIQLYDFMGDDIIARYDSSLWEDMAEMMSRMAEMMGSENPGWADELFGSNDGVRANPYEGLGDLLSR